MFTGFTRFAPSYPEKPKIDINFCSTKLKDLLKQKNIFNSG